MGSVSPRGPEIDAVKRFARCRSINSSGNSSMGLFTYILTICRRHVAPARNLSKCCGRQTTNVSPTFITALTHHFVLFDAAMAGV